MSTQPNLDRARKAWGDELPAWVERLAIECDAADQVTVAKILDYSNGAINAVIGRKYTASLSRIESAVDGAFGGATVPCPVPGLGDLPAHRCIEHQRQPYTGTNPTRIRLYRACRGGCPHSRIGRKAKESA